MTHKVVSSDGILDSKGRQTPLALVTEWGMGSLCVICPYCLERHRHGIGVPLPSERSRVPHCGDPEGHYQMCYPFESPASGSYSYRIDKSRGLFVTVGIAANDEDDEDDESEEDCECNADVNSEDGGDGDVDVGVGVGDKDDSRGNVFDDQSLSKDLDRLNISDGQPQEPLSIHDSLAELFQDHSYRQMVFDAHCVTNSLHEIASLLEAYEDDDFVTYRDSHRVNCIALAAVEGHDKMVQFLHRKGGDLDNVDCRGRTPLMQAALWGRVQAVRVLLQGGADPHARDRKGRNAYFYSMPSKQTSRMRAQFSRYREHCKASTNRRNITNMLQRYEPATAADEVAGSNEAKPGVFIRQETVRGSRIVYYEPSSTYDLPDMSKTMARLHRGAMFPIISAASGWRTDFAVDTVLDNRLWRDRVLQLCELIAYDLPWHHLDGAEPRGSFYASHAEKKLIAYYVHEHTILPSQTPSSARSTKNPGSGSVMSL